MKILFYIESLRSGGKERRLVELIKGLKQYPDIEMELVLTREDIHYTDIFDTGIKIHYTIRKGLKKDPRIFWKFYRIAKEFKPDIIHVWGSMVAIYAIPAKLALNIPLLNNSITYAVKVKKYSSFWVYSNISFMFSDKVIANSNAGLRAHGLSKNKKYHIIYNGYNFNRLSNISVELRKELNLNSKIFVIGMVASLSESKDYVTLLKAAKILSKTHKDIHFVCVGDGINKKFLMDITEKNNLCNVSFIGKRNDVDALCKEFDIGVLLSNTAGHAEGISNSIMEVMAVGKPIIATKAGGTPELVIDNKSGFLIKAFDEKMLANKILQLYNNSKLRKTFGKKGKDIIKNKFDIEIMIKSYIQLYQNSINNN